MTQKEFESINWHRGNVARLNNGKEYLVKGVKGHGRYLLLFSDEYEKCFVADYKIVDSRTSDYEEPLEVYLEHRRKKQEAAEALREAERQERLKAKEERKRLHQLEQERIHQEALARKAAKAAAKAAANAAKAGEKAAAKAAKKVEAAKEVSPKTVEKVAAKEVTPKVAEKVEAAPAEEEAPKKRVRQRVRIAASIREKVEFLRKK